jgi:putative endonuclease
MNQKYVQGKQGEDQAEAYLVESGHTILKRNFRNYVGEIDIISLSGSTLFFIEVKNWKSDQYIHPLEIFTAKKIKVMRTLASIFIADNLAYQENLVSFALLRVTDSEIIFYKDLF